MGIEIDAVDLAVACSVSEIGGRLKNHVAAVPRDMGQVAGLVSGRDAVGGGDEDRGHSLEIGSINLGKRGTYG